MKFSELLDILNKSTSSHEVNHILKNINLDGLDYSKLTALINSIDNNVFINSYGDLCDLANPLIYVCLVYIISILIAIISLPFSWMISASIIILLICLTPVACKDVNTPRQLRKLRNFRKIMEEKVKLCESNFNNSLNKNIKKEGKNEEVDKNVALACKYIRLISELKYEGYLLDIEMLGNETRKYISDMSSVNKDIELTLFPSIVNFPIILSQIERKIDSIIEAREYEKLNNGELQNTLNAFQRAKRKSTSSS